MDSLADKNSSAMEGVSLLAARILVGLLAEGTAVEKELLRRRFSEKAVGFEETLVFIEGMHGIIDDERRVRCSRGFTRMREALTEGETAFVRYMAKLGVTSARDYGRELRRVLNAFRFQDGQACLRRGDLEPELYAARNVLLEAGAMLLDHRAGTYEINGWFYEEFIKARYARGTTPDKLSEEIHDKTNLGLAAELVVLEYERGMVGTGDAPNVIHIAQHNTNAGFDIASIRRENKDGGLNFRMIEVKAVSPRDWAFTFTRNEVRVATENKNIYFLYLVPVDKGKPIVDAMEVIRNPVEKLVHKEEWIIEEGDWTVSRKTSRV